MTVTYFSDDLRNIVPYMSDYTFRDVTVSASGENEGYEAWKAFDRSVDGSNNYWAIDGTRSAWIMIDLGVSRLVKSYGLTSNPRVGDALITCNMMPRDWQFQGSYNGVYWTTLDSQTYKTWDDFIQIREFTITNPSYYRYYRLNITSNYWEDITGVGEFSLFGDGKCVVSPTGLVTLIPSVSGVDASEFSGLNKNGVIAVLKLPSAELSSMFLPISSFSVRRESGAVKYIQVVVPGKDLVESIADRSDGMISLYSVINDNCLKMGELSITSLRYDEGPNSQSITLQAAA